MHALEHRARPDKAGTCQQSGTQTGLGGPSRVQPLGPGALREIFDDAARHAAGNTECIDDLPRVEAERGADTRGRAHRAKDRGRMEAGLVHRLGHDEAEAAQHLGADRNTDQRHAAVRIVPLAGREHGRHDDGPGMHGATLERVVEILAMRGGAVDEGRARRGQHARMADRGAATVIVRAAEAAANIILVARGDTEPDHVDQQILAFARGRLRQAARFQRHDPLGKRLRDGTLRQPELMSGDQTWKILL